MKLILYHNPRCRKSREALRFLEKKKINFEIVKYLNQKFDENSLQKVLKIIRKKPSEILRKNEIIWKTNYLNKDLDDNEIVKLMVKYPNLIQRPIVTSTKKGVLARPLEKLIDFVSEV
tara:strand:+ start:445 stop:798 length:354 start_codon:yes stop_codon:yes gene_type:complete